MTLAIGLHNIPEGLAVATVLVARGVSPKSALIWCAQSRTWHFWLPSAVRLCNPGQETTFCQDPTAPRVVRV